MHNPFSPLARSLAAAMVVAALPHAAGAQSGTGPFIGAGAGISGVTEVGSSASRAGVGLHFRTGWEVSRSLALVVESNLDGLGGIRQDSAFLSNDPFIDPSRSRQLGTISLLGSVRFAGPAGFYARPGVGMARHAYTVRDLHANDAIILDTRAEWGPAAGLAVGRELRVIPGMPLGLEAVVHWSGGDDVTGARWTAGLQVTRDLRIRLP